jgi:hypothetical protein
VSQGYAWASALLEEVARQRGLDVRRLDDELVVCGDGQRRVLFHGLTSSVSGRVAQVLCRNDAWLRGHLARHGLPVIPTRLVGVDDPRHAQRAAEALGFPVRMRLAGVRDAERDRTAADLDAFHSSWRSLVRGASSPDDQVILECRPDGPVVDVVVVGGRVDTAGGIDSLAEPVRARAVAAVAALPGASYGLVRLVPAAAGPVIDTVDPALGGDLAPSRDLAAALARALLDHLLPPPHSAPGNPPG